MTKKNCKSKQVDVCPNCQSIILPDDLVIVSRSMFKKALKGLQNPFDKRRKPRSPIEQDEVVRDYLLQNENKKTYEEMKKWLLQNVGKARTPSKSSVSRFYKRQLKIPR